MTKSMKLKTIVSLMLFIGVSLLGIACGSGGGSGSSNGEGAPSLPANLTADATSFNQIYLQWDDNSFNETGFKLER